MTIGDRIRDIRKRKGLTQAALGELTGISADIIRKYENGVRTPKDDRVEEIAKALEVSTYSITGTSVPVDEEFMQILMELDDSCKLNIERNDEEITIKIPNAIYGANKLYTYFNAWLNAREELDNLDNVNNIFDYESWKSTFPLNINDLFERKMKFHKQDFAELTKKQAKSHEKIARRSQLILLLKELVENNTQLLCFGSQATTIAKIPKVVGIPTVAFRCENVDEMLNPYTDDKIVDYTIEGKNKKIKELYAKFLLAIKDIEEIGFTVDKYLAIKNNILYMCYTFNIVDLYDIVYDVALIKNQMPHEGRINYYHPDLIDDSPEHFEKNFSARCDELDFFFRDKLESNPI